MKTFWTTLKRYNPPPSETRRWLFVPYDQLSDQIGPLSREEPENLTIILIETKWKARQRPYHKQKLALILSNMRHFAVEQAKRGVHVRYIAGEESYAQLLSRNLPAPARTMRPAEYELRTQLQPLFESGLLTEIPHEGWLSSRQDFRASMKKSKQWLMARFYQHMRKKTDLLMQDGKPVGGKYSFDHENRLPWSGEPTAAVPPTFPSDPIKEEVCQTIQEQFSHHPGVLNAASLPCTQRDANALWQWVKQSCLPFFGPYEDAMSTRSTNLFHSRVSALLHLHRLLPRTVVYEANDLDIPINSKEGWIRQILGWREFMRHVHEETNGFRSGHHTKESPSFKSFEEWSHQEWTPPPGSDGGSLINQMQYETPLPAAYWGAKSGLNCLDSIVKNVWDEGYAHHIPRLMVLANISTLLEIEPRAITDWFWVAFIDAFDWVVEPNVLAMGVFATPIMTTKPYISGANYIDKMSDYCGGCAFHPKKTCPVSRLYWAYLARHQDALSGNFRLRMIFSTLRRRTPEKKAEDQRIYRVTCKTLAEGKPLTPSLYKSTTPPKVKSES